MEECQGKLREQKKRRNKCVVKFCTTEAGKRTRFCYRHHRQYQRENNPSRYFFDHLRQNARRRKIGFELTIEQFRAFCDRTGYLERKGRMKDCYSIDRIDPQKPYTADNIQVLTVGLNSRKKHVDFKIKYGRYPDKEDLEYFKELMKCEGNEEPQLPEFEVNIDPNEVPY